MPAKNSRKQFMPDAYYHLYNRGVEKRTIFQDNQDYAVFLSYLKTYLLPKDTKKLHDILLDPKTSLKEKDQAKKKLHLNNFSKNLKLLAYCLMPNHFHFLVKQKEENTIDQFMNSLLTRYVMYFNRKHRRVGHLFQGVYKAVLVNTDEQLLHLSRYIHLNPALQGQALHDLRGYKYSSYQNYLINPSLNSTLNNWIQPAEILSFFGKSGFNSYQSFVQDKGLDEVSAHHISKISLD